MDEGALSITLQDAADQPILEPELKPDACLGSNYPNGPVYS